MLAAICPVYGPPEVIRIETVPDPVPGKGEVMIRVMASTVSSADHRVRGMVLPRGFGPIGRAMFGLRRPRRPILGTELAGVIVALGEGVGSWRIGQEVVAAPGAKMGAHAEMICLAADAAIARKPENMGFAEAAALSFGGTTALYFLRDRAKLQPNETVLITGAGGAVGSAALQIARAMGAEVTAMACPGKVDALNGLGVTDVIASGQEPPGDRRWDVIVDCAGIVDMRRARGWLAPQGRLCQVLADMGQLLAGMVVRLGDGRRAIGGAAPERAADLREVVQLVEAGHFRPLIGATLPFAQIVEAHRIAAGRHKLGSTVIEMP